MKHSLPPGSVDPRLESWCTALNSMKEKLYLGNASHLKWAAVMHLHPLQFVFSRWIELHLPKNGNQPVSYWVFVGCFNSH